MSRFDRKFETNEVMPLLLRGLLVDDRETVSRADNSGGVTHASEAKTPWYGMEYWPDAVLLFQTDVRKACTIHHLPARELDDAIPRICRHF